MNNDLLQFLVQHMGKPDLSRSKYYHFYCPKCHHHKPKLGINRSSPHGFKCFKCNFKGKTLIPLIRYFGLSKSELFEIKLIIPTEGGFVEKKNYEPVKLPDEFLYLGDYDSFSIQDKMWASRALEYLNERGVSDWEIKRYNIGFCTKGKYKFRIIIPSYDSNGNVNDFVARTWHVGFEIPNYIQPELDASERIPFEYYLDFNQPITICEGFFDAMAIRFNAAPIAGKEIPEALDLALIKNNTPIINIALDKDALYRAMDYIIYYDSLGFDVRLVDMPDKDPAILGFDTMFDLISNARKFTFEDQVKYRLEVPSPMGYRYSKGIKYSKPEYESDFFREVREKLQGDFKRVPTIRNSLY